MSSYMCHKSPVTLRDIIYCLHFSPHPTWFLWSILYQDLHLHFLYWSFFTSLDFSSLFSSFSEIAKVSQNFNHQLHTNSSWMYAPVILWSRFLLTLNWILSASCPVGTLDSMSSKAHSSFYPQTCFFSFFSLGWWNCYNRIVVDFHSTVCSHLESF